MAGNKRKIQEINAGSMADIAFLLLIFFLVATTMSTDYGINRILPPWQEDQDQEMQVKERNLFLVFVDKSNRIMAGGEVIELWQLKDRAKEFVLNPTNSPDLPEMVPTNIELIGTVPVSSGIISLQNDRGASYETYIAIQNELTKVFNELREDASQKYFSKSYRHLVKEQRDAVNTAVPQKISEAEPRQIK